MPAVLEIKKGVGKGGKFEIREGDVLRVGRDSRNDIVLSDLAISRVHCVFEFRGEACTVRDLGGVNGTYVNRIRVREAELKDGDLVVIGKKSLVMFRLTPSEAEAELADQPAKRPEPAAAEEPNIFQEAPQETIEDAAPPIPELQVDFRETDKIDGEPPFEMSPAKTVIANQSGLESEPIDLDAESAEPIEPESLDAEPIEPEPIESTPEENGAFEIDVATLEAVEAQGEEMPAALPQDEEARGKKKRKGGLFGKLLGRKKGEDKNDGGE